MELLFLKKNIYAKIIVVIIIAFFIALHFLISGDMRKRTENETRKSLKIVLTTTKKALHDWKNRHEQTLTVWSKSATIQNNITKIKSTSIDQEKYYQKSISDTLRPLMETENYLNYFIIDREGKVLSSSISQKNSILDHITKNKPFFHKLWTKDVSLSNIIKVKLNKKYNPSIFIGKGIQDDRGIISSAIIFQVDPSADFSRIFQRGRIGHSGETYALNSDGIMISESRFTQQLNKINLLGINQSTLLNLKILNPGINLLEHSKDFVPSKNSLTEMAKDLTQTKNHKDIHGNLKGYRDYRGVNVVGLWVWDKVFNIGITTEIDNNEVYANLNTNIKTLKIFIIFTCLLVIFIVHFFSKKRKWLEDIIEARTKKLKYEIITKEKLTQELESQKFATDQHALVSITDTKGTILYANDMFCECSQYDRDELVGQNHRIIGSGIHSKKFWRNCWNSIQDGDTWKSEVANKAKDGSIFWVDGTIIPFRDTTGDIVKYISIQSNITERKTAETKIKNAMKEIQKLAKVKSEFLANMSHELRTPLNSLLILSKMLYENEEGHLDEDEVKSAGIIHSCGTELLALINDILDLSKMESGKMEYIVDEFSPEELKVGIKKSFDHMAKEKGLELSVTLSDDIPQTVYTDKQKVQQILKNLVSNSLKFTKKGEILVEIYAPDEVPKSLSLESKEAIAISVTDCGIGIPQDKLEFIFEAFRQVDGSIQRKYGGTGLGLSISRKFAHLLKGELTVQSTEGVKTVFTLFIPFDISQSEDRDHSLSKSLNLSEPQEGESIPAENEVIRKLQHNKHVLIIDNDMRSNFSLIKSSKNTGLKISIADNIQDSKHIMKNKLETKIDLILINTSMKNLDPLALIKELKQNEDLNNIQIIALLDQSEKDELGKFLKAGVVDYLERPLDIKKLISLLNDENPPYAA